MKALLPWRLVFALGITSCLSGWFAVPDVQPSAPLVRPRADAWDLPEVPRPLSPGAEALLLAAQPIWGPEAKPAQAQAPAEDLRWRLAGLFGKGKDGGCVVIFMDPAKPPQRLRVGDKLPDGRRIEAVDGPELLVREGKKKPERIGVERSE